MRMRIYIKPLNKKSIGRIATLVCAGIYLLVAPQGVSAMSSDQKKIFQSGINQFNVEADAKTCSVNVASGSGSLVGSDNPEKAFRYLMDKGSLEAAQVAGIVGNLMWESGGVDPTSSSNDGGTIGIAQWEGGRDDALKAFAQKAGKPWQDLGVQLDYLWSELNGSEKAALDAVMATHTPETAAVAFEEKFERAGVPHMDERIKNAQEMMSKYGGGSGDAANTIEVTSSDCNSTTSSGGATEYVGNFAIYSQYDKRWASNPYGTSTVAASGCGPSAMAMIITALSGKIVDPAATTKYADQLGEYIPGSGSSWNVAPDLAKHWGLNAKPIGADMASINATLQAGGLVIGSGNGPKPFTTGGHYIVIRALTADGKWMVGDSAHSDTNKIAYPPSQISTYLHDGSVYAITK